MMILYYEKQIINQRQEITKKQSLTRKALTLTDDKLMVLNWYGIFSMIL
jgi:hypothetical protein